MLMPLVTFLFLSALMASSPHNAYAGAANIDDRQTLQIDKKHVSDTKDKSGGTVDIPDEIMEELRKAAQDDKLWQAAMRNTNQYLMERHLKIPSHITLNLYDAGWDTKAPAIHSSEFDTDPSSSNCNTLRNLLPGRECPPGYRLIKTVKKIKQCVKYGIAVTGKEWIPTVEGTPWGHFEFETVTKCLLEIETEVTFTACLPLIKVFGESIPPKPGQ
ncbi:MAG: hypothetical protein JSS38_11005 [Nitrospira sp.]|nr:hypothetical protein [Nitrospira sp.]